MMNFSINQPDKDKQYTSRPGAYALIQDSDGLIAIVIETKVGYFLPGGGIEGSESPEECLRRECREEIGAEILDLKEIAIGKYYFYSTTYNCYMENIGNFFACKIDRFLETKTEDDHELIWLSKEKAIELLYLENQKEAVRILNKK